MIEQPENAPATLTHQTSAPMAVENATPHAAGRVSDASPLIDRLFTSADRHPYDDISWEYRTAAITSDSGAVLFEQKDAEVPAFWSQNATNIVVSKYFYGDVRGAERETSVRQLVDRVAVTIARWGRDGGYFRSEAEGECFEQELRFLLANQYAAFNSPVWFNVGVVEKPQCSACFINSVDDTMESIMDLATREALLFKWGSGTGTNLSTLRSRREKLTGGGVPSGPVSLHARLRRLRQRDQVWRQDPPRGQDGHPGRRPPRHHGVHPVQGRRGAESLGAHR